MATPQRAAPCPECGADLVVELDGPSLRVRCAACDWAVATTNEHHPVFDPTRYAVFVSEKRPERTALISILSAELGLEIGYARALTDHGRPLATDASATEVRRLGRRLRVRGVALSTEPPFPWPWEDNP